MAGELRKNHPLVTGISPKSGAAGTKVTIRGENLGTSREDLVGLRICGKDCLLSADWKSPNKIIALTGHARGLGDIIVATISGGIGTCTVKFEGKIKYTSVTQESAIWVDEADQWLANASRSTMTSTLDFGEYDNPLGVSDHTDDAKMSKDWSDHFPDSSARTDSNDFHPALYLLQYHSGTSFADMKGGLNELRRRLNNKQDGQSAFIKSNLTNLMDCQDTLAEMHRLLVKDKESCPNEDITVALEKILIEANESSDKLFKDVLRRRDRADATRNAISVINRFQFLFYLPCSIDENIKRGEYDLVINDYMRAKFLFGDTEVEVFKKVYREVEKRVEAFRDRLYKQLLQLPSTVDEQKRLIRYLVHLETSGNPAWECLENIQKWLISLLHTCKDQHLMKEKENERGDKKNDDKLLLRSPLRRIHKGNKDLNRASKAPQRVTYVEDMTKILLDYFPDLWHLGQAYLSGKLLKEVKDRNFSNDSTKFEDFKLLVLGVIKLFCNLVRAAFLPQTLEDLEDDKRSQYGLWSVNQASPTAWLPISVRVVRSFVTSISQQELSNDCMEILQELAFDMRTHCVSTLFKQATQDVKSLHQRETWNVDSDDEKGGTTYLPYLFENIVTEMIQQLHEVLLSRPGESEVFSNVPIQKEVVQLCIQLIEAFAGTTEQLALIGNMENQPKSNTDERSRIALISEFYDKGEPGKMPSLDRRLLIMLSNCQHCRGYILPRITEHLEKHGYPETQSILEITSKHFIDLEGRLFEKYIEEKSNPIIGVLEQNMYAGHFDWNDLLACTGVRRYIKEAIMSIIEVHAEVYSVNPHLVPQVIGLVVWRVIDELARLIVCVTGFNKNGALQARLELYAMEIATADYRTKDTSSLLKEALDCLPKVTALEDKKLLDDGLNLFRTQMKLHLVCLKPIQDDETY